MDRTLNRGGAKGVRATIASGQTVSDAVDIRGYALIGFALPSTFDGTAMTFQVCDSEAGTFQVLEDQFGNAVSMTVEASRSYTIPNEIAPWSFFKFVAGSSQTTTDTVIIVARKA